MSFAVGAFAAVTVLARVTVSVSGGVTTELRETKMTGASEGELSLLENNGKNVEAA